MYVNTLAYVSICSYSYLTVNAKIKQQNKNYKRFRDFQR